MEWFLNSLLPYIVKDVSTSVVQNEEQVIFRAQELDLIYAQSGLLYEIIPNTPCSSFDPKVKPGPHADGIVGCASVKPRDLLWDKLRLRLNPPKRRVYFLCNHWTIRVTSSLDGTEKRVKIIIRVGIRMRMLIVMKRTVGILGGTSKLNVRLISLASYVRTITSLTCALVLMKPRDSWHRDQLC